jgi:hypothetical protein
VDDSHAAAAGLTGEAFHQGDQAVDVWGGRAGRAGGSPG